MATVPKPPKPFNYDAVMPIDEWEKWLNSFNNCLCVLNSLSDNEKIVILLDELGPKGKELFESFKTNPPSIVARSSETTTDHPGSSDQEPHNFDFSKFDDVISAFTAHFSSKSERNLVYERFKFNTYNWLFGQSLRDYIKVLRRAAARCDFLEMDSMIRDRLLLQVRDISLLERLLKIKGLTLDEAVEICQEHEDKDYRHNPAAQRPPPESESAAKRRRKRKRKLEASSADQSNGEQCRDSGVERDYSYNKGHDTTKLRPSKKKRHRWARAIQNVKDAMQV